MMDAIDFFERMGRDAQLRHATPEDLERALARAEIDPAVRAAVISNDAQQLRALLGARADLCCLIEKPDEGGEDEEGEDEDCADRATTT